MINYYEVLGIEIDAASNVIRRSYRDLVKKHHPDIIGNDKESTDQFRKIRDAYDTLIHAETRRVYDAKLKATIVLTPTTSPEAHLKNRTDPKSRARLVFFYLLNEEFDEALKTLEESRLRDPGFDLEKLLDDRDYRDCEFLMGEAYERLGKWARALNCYEKVFHREMENPVRFFLPALKDRIRFIYCKRIAKTCSPAAALDIYRKVLNMGFDRKVNAHLHKKMAEALFKLNDVRKAREHLQMAMDLEPHLKGAQKISDKLGSGERDETREQEVVSAR